MAAESRAPWSPASYFSQYLSDLPILCEIS